MYRKIRCDGYCSTFLGIRGSTKHAVNCILGWLFVTYSCVSDEIVTAGQREIAHVVQNRQLLNAELPGILF